MLIEMHQKESVLSFFGPPSALPILCCACVYLASFLYCHCYLLLLIGCGSRLSFYLPRTVPVTWAANSQMNEFLSSTVNMRMQPKLTILIWESRIWKSRLDSTQGNLPRPVVWKPSVLVMIVFLYITLFNEGCLQYCCFSFRMSTFHCQQVWEQTSWLTRDHNRSLCNVPVNVLCWLSFDKAAFVSLA